MKLQDIEGGLCAIVGSMAAGKNYICSRLSADGYYCIDGDELIHQILAKDQIQDRIISEFREEAARRGITLQNTDGSLNRRALGQIVFSDKRLLARHEAIVYPEFEKEAERIIETAPKRGGTVLNAAVLYKTPALLKKCDKIIFVSAPLLLRFLRAMRRDKINPVQIIKRFWAQRGLFGAYKKFAKENSIQFIKIINL